MKVALSHPTGNQNVREVMLAFLEAGVLAEFGTTIAVDSRELWLKLLPTRMRQEWLRRAYTIPVGQLWTHPLWELARILLPQVGLSSYTRHEKGWASIDAVYQNFDHAAAQRLSFQQKKFVVDTVYAYEDGALATFEQAKKLGMRRIYDLPIAYWEIGRKLLLEEAERLPGWAITLTGIQDSPEKLERKVRELELADAVVVPSAFVKESLPTWACSKPAIIVPFGSPSVHPLILRDKKSNAHSPLRVLFVGSMGQRKGLGDLLAAVRYLNSPNLELVVLGSPLAPLEFYRQELPSFIYESGRPHDQVLALMRSCDVFCLPSIVEGRALVMQEAMSQGLPLIITPNTGGEDLIEEGRTGFLVPIRSPHAIAEKLTWFLENRDKLPEMRRLSRAHAATYTWKNYGANILTALHKIN